jgi:hypothetical protein
MQQQQRRRRRVAADRAPDPRFADSDMPAAVVAEPRRHPTAAHACAPGQGIDLD